MTYKKKWGIASLALAFGILLAGCPQPDDSTSAAKSNNAELTSITVGGTAATKGTPAATWDDAAIVAGSVTVLDTALSTAEVEVVTGNTKASVEFAKAAGSATPAFGTTSPTAFANGDFLYIKVTAEAGNQQVYKIQVVATNTNAKLSSAKVGGVAATLGNPGTISSATAGAVTLSSTQAAGAAIEATAQASSGVTIGFGKGTDTTEPASYITSGTLTLANNDFVWIKVSAGNDTVLYYKIKITVELNSSTVITNVKIKGTDIVTGASGTTFQNAAEVIYRPASADGLQNVTLTATAPTSGSYKAVYSTDGGATTIDLPQIGRNMSSGEYIGIEVTAENGTKAYYKFLVRFGSNVAKLTSISVNGTNGPAHLADEAWNTVRNDYTTPTGAYNSAAAAQYEGNWLIGWPAFGYGVVGENYTIVPRSPLSKTFSFANMPTTLTINAVAASNGTVLYALSPNEDGFHLLSDNSLAFDLSPAAGQASGSFTSAVVKNGVYIWVQVTSEDGTAVNYYRFRVGGGSNNAGINSLTVAGKTVTLAGKTFSTLAAALASPADLLFLTTTQADTPYIATATAGQYGTTYTDAAQLPPGPQATSADGNAIVTYGTVDGTSGAVTWQDSSYTFFLRQEITIDFGGFPWTIVLAPKGLLDGMRVAVRIESPDLSAATYVVVQLGVKASLNSIKTNATNASGSQGTFPAFAIADIQGKTTVKFTFSATSIADDHGITIVRDLAGEAGYGTTIIDLTNQVPSTLPEGGQFVINVPVTTIQTAWDTNESMNADGAKATGKFAINTNMGWATVVDVEATN